MEASTENSSTVLLLNEAEVNRLVGAADAIAALEDLLSNWIAGQVANIPRRRASIPGFMLHGMSAADARLERAVWKQYTTTRRSARFHVGLYDTVSGKLLALIQANRLGQLRTGAMSALAARYLTSGPDVGQVALIGCGWQAESQLECLLQLFPQASVRVFCRDVERRRRFARDMGQRLQAKIEASNSAEACVRGAETVITMTNASQPVVEAAWLDRCRLIIAAGSNQPQNAEIPSSVVSAAQRIVVDDLEGCRHEAGDLIIAASPLEDADNLWSRVETLASVIGAKVTLESRNMGSTDQPQGGLVLFKSVGMAASDLAIASLIYDRAYQHNVGQRIAL